jgi:uncharacterized protein (DUF362 family)
MSVVVVAKLMKGEKAGKFTVDDYKALLGCGLENLGGGANAATAISKYCPGGVVGIKTNCIARKLNSTPVALADALTQLLIDSGVEENNVIVWERTSRELESAGYKLNASSFGRRCLGTDVDQAGYGRTFYSSGEVNSLVSRILTDIVTHNINLPVLKDHSIAGLSGGLKNMYGVINNPNKYHDNHCDPYAAHVSNLAPVREKNKLTIVDAVQVQYNGGPGYVSRYLDYFNGLIISDDPVAADSIGLQVVEELRKRHSMPPLAEVGRPVRYLATAEQLGLGVADRSQIDLRVLAIRPDGRVSRGSLF